MKGIAGIAILTMLMACNQADQKSTEQKDTLVKVVKQRKQIVLLKDKNYDEVFKKYIDLKNALVQSNRVLAQQEATALYNTLNVLTEHKETATLAQKISNEQTLEGQRKTFTALSANLIAMFKKADIADGIIYVQHCPMANKGDGGDWLALEKEIKNPYYGDEMLNCGRVLEEIKNK